MNPGIYVTKTGQRYGPYSIQELNEQLDAAVFNLEDFASTDSGQHWGHIRELPDAALNGFGVGTDQSNNVLTITYRGSIGTPEVERCAKQVLTALEQMQSGFRLLVDLTDLQRMDTRIAPQIEKIMDLCNAKKVAAVIRVIPDPTRDIGLQIMSLFHYGADVRIVTCANADEAMRALVD